MSLNERQSQNPVCQGKEPKTYSSPHWEVFVHGVPGNTLKVMRKSFKGGIICDYNF